MAVQIQFRRDTGANWTAVNPILAQGEIGYNLDNHQLKVGDGTSAWNTLTYYAGGFVGTYPLVNADIAVGAAIDWTKISKVGSSLADLATRSAGDLSTGTLLAARLPATVVQTTDTGSVTSAMITNSTIVDGDISASAAIAKSKLAALAIVDADVAAGAAIAKSKLASLAIADADVAAGAAIGWTKISKTGSSLADLVTRSATDLTSGTIPAARLPVFVASGASHAVGAVPDPGVTTGTTKFLREDATWVVPPGSYAGSYPIVNADIAAGAAIAYSKLNLATSIVNADIAAGAAIAYSKLNLANSIVTGDIVANAIDNTDLRDSGALSVIGRTANTTGDPADISAVAASGAVLRESGSTIGFGTIATAGITDNAITDAKMRDSAGFTLYGKAATGTGDPADISIAADSLVGRSGSGNIAGQGFSATPTAATIVKSGAGTTIAAGWLPIFVASGASHAAGAVPDPGVTAGTTRYLREDATWVAPAAGGGTPATTVTDLDGGAQVVGVGTNYARDDHKHGISNNAISNAQLRDSTALTVIGRTANSTGDPADIAATAASGAVLRESGSTIGFGTVATAGIADNAITDVKLRDSAGFSVIGRAATATGDPADIAIAADQLLGRSGSGNVAGQAFSATPAAATILKSGAGNTIATGWLPVFVASGASHAIGAVPDPGVTAGTTKFLREDATWVVPPGGYTGSYPIVNADIAAGAAIAWTKIDKAGSSLLDLATRSAGDLNSGTLPAARLPVFVASGGSHAIGAVPDPGATGGTTKFLREDATWAVPAGGSGSVPDPLILLNDITAQSTAAGQVKIGAIGPGAAAGIEFGTAGDAHIWKVSAYSLYTDAHWSNTGVMSARSAQAAQTTIGDVGPGAAAGIAFGSAADAVIYRIGAGTIATTSALLSLNSTLTAAVISTFNLSETVNRFDILNSGAHQWGSGAAAADARLYRSAARVLTLDDTAGNGATLDFPDLTQAASISTGTTFGLKVGTAATQKLGFFNATPIVRPSSTTDLRAALINLGLYTTGGATPLDLNGGAAVVGSLASAGAISSSSASAGVGYATGAGGTATQTGTITTTVVLSKPTGKITLFSGARASQVSNNFTLTNTAIAATDQIVITHISGGTLGAYSFAAAAAAGSAVITVRNIHTASLTEAPVIRFSIIKSVDA